MKVILNKCFGGFGLSPIATIMYAEKKGVTLYPYKYDYRVKDGMYYIRIKNIEEIKNTDYFFTEDYGDRVCSKDVNTYYYPDKNEIRTDPDLISIVEELGEKANGRYSELVIVDIPDELDGKYVIDDYDGKETLHEDVPVW